MEQDLNVSVENKGSKGSSTFAAITIVICIVIGALLWKFVIILL